MDAMDEMEWSVGRVENESETVSGPAMHTIPCPVGLGHEPADGRWTDGWVWHERQFSPRRSPVNAEEAPRSVRPPASSVSPLRPPIRAVTDIRLARLRNLAPPPPLPLTDLQGCPLATSPHLRTGRRNSQPKIKECEVMHVTLNWLK